MDKVKQKFQNENIHSGGMSSREKSPLKGVQPKLHKRKVPLAPPAMGENCPNFAYHGGPVVNNPQVNIIFLGDWSSTANQNRATRLSQFMIDLLSSKYMNILSQYGCGSSGDLINSVFIASSNHNLSDSNVQSILQNAINNQIIPEPINRSNIYIVYLDDDTGIINDPDGGNMCEATNDNAFGYHFFFTTTAGNPCYYAIVPGLTDACLKNSCQNDDAGCSLHLAQTQEQRQTQVTSHEFSEMISDPEVVSNEGWSDQTGGCQHENGDICNAQSDTIVVGSNTWTIQLMYSKRDDKSSNGATMCIVESQNPLSSFLPVKGVGPRVACAANQQRDLHVLAIDQNNGLWHTIRKADGTWSPFGDVQAQVRLVGPNPGIGRTPRVACATNPEGDLHVLAIDQNSGLWHTIRMADGTWPFAFGDVQAQTRLVGPNPGIGPTPFVACATNQQSDLHVLAIDQNNGLWHTIRMADGTWPFAFGDVQAQTSG